MDTYIATPAYLPEHAQSPIQYEMKSNILGGAQGVRNLGTLETCLVLHGAVVGKCLKTRSQWNWHFIFLCISIKIFDQETSKICESTSIRTNLIEGTGVELEKRL